MSLLANGHIEATRRLHIHLNENGHSARATILQARARGQAINRLIETHGVANFRNFAGKEHCRVV